MVSPIAYTVPHITIPITVSLFLYLLNVAEYLFSLISNAGLVGSMAVGVIFGPAASNILPDHVQNTFIILGYIGLILIVFEAGLSTDISLLYSNILLSSIVAISGVSLPIAFSLLLLPVCYGYTLLQGFGAGAALCSTSLGTTLALLNPELRQTRTGAILLSAALLDDIIGLIFAAIIPKLSEHEGSKASGVQWHTIARPILVSLAFGVGTFLGALSARKLYAVLPSPWRSTLHTGHAQVFLIVSTLSGFIASSRYAGTSELFGAYLTGTFLAYVFQPQIHSTANLIIPYDFHTPTSAFTIYFLPLLHRLFSPVFFASIGATLPIRSLGSTNGSRRVVWRGIVYSLLMIVAKASVGLWILIWPDPQPGQGWCTTRPHKKQTTPSSEVQDSIPPPVTGDGGIMVITRPRSAALTGLAMVARGEIALIVAQLARPLLAGDMTLHPEDTSEPFAVVIWAILLSTIGGALGVGLLLRSWEKRT